MNDITKALASLFVGHPPNIAVAGAVFLAAHLALEFRRRDAGRRSTALRTVGVAWLLYAAWEWLVLVATPDADVRVDLLLIWPLLAAISIWFTLKALRQSVARRG